MSKSLPVAAGLVTILFALGPAATAAPHSETQLVRAGRELAENICSACHVVETNQEFPPILQHPTPSFQEIADRPGTTLDGLRHFLAHTKWDEHSMPMKMPGLMLMPEQETQLAHYILSLRTPTPR